MRVVMEIDEAMFYGSPHRHRAVDQLLATIEADVPHQVRKMVSEGWDLEGAIEACVRWWFAITRQAITDGEAAAWRDAG